MLSQRPDPVVEGCGYIASVTRGIVFLGTPHTRPKSALSLWASLWSQVLGIFGGPYGRLLKTLRLLYPEPERINQDFLAIPAIRELPNHSLVSFYETRSQIFGVSVPVTITADSFNVVSACGGTAVGFSRDRHAHGSGLGP